MSRYDWGQTHPGITRLENAVDEARIRVVTHPLYANLDTHTAIVTFMEHHVFAVWDFMSLLKSLQRNLTCVRVPWVPSGPTGSRRRKPTPRSSTGSSICSAPAYVQRALTEVAVPAPAAEFVRTTWEFVESAPVHSQAAAFAFGREDLIPDMFTKVVEVKEQGHKLDTFVDYLERHLEVDGEEHTPMAMQMLADLCGDDAPKWQACAQTVNRALAARYQLWDGILDAIKAKAG